MSVLTKTFVYKVYAKIEGTVHEAQVAQGGAPGQYCPRGDKTHQKHARVPDKIGYLTALSRG